MRKGRNESSPPSKCVDVYAIHKNTKRPCPVIVECASQLEWSQGLRVIQSGVHYPVFIRYIFKYKTNLYLYIYVVHSDHNNQTQFVPINDVCRTRAHCMHISTTSKSNNKFGINYLWATITVLWIFISPVLLLWSTLDTTTTNCRFMSVFK